MELAAKNARNLLEQNKEKYRREQKKTIGAVHEIEELIGIEGIHRMESYDISNTNGYESVASMIVYEDGKPKRNNYRKFKIKTVHGPDDYARGKALAQEVLRDFNGNVKGKALGFAVQDENAADVISRKKGFEDALQGKGVRVSWTVSVSMEKSGRHRLENQSKTDIVVALDDISLIRAGECSAANDLHGAMIYGIGHSTEAIYYLDTGVAECLVVPDEFNRGYQSLTETAETLGHVWHVMKNKVLSHKVIRREELFLKENQEILFAMNQ